MEHERWRLLTRHITERVDIVELIGQYVRLKKVGARYVGLCPFHQEKTPSFFVNPRLQTYHCFGCGAHDSAIGFMMQHQNLSFKEALESLARPLGLDLPDFSHDPTPSTHTPLCALMRAVHHFYQTALKRSKTAQAYLCQRGINNPMIEEFGIGFAPDAWGFLANSPFGKEHEAHLIELGVLIQNQTGTTYDRFRNRIIFPIRDPRGEVIAFGGRLMEPISNQPKYLNSPETVLFQKRDTLYGLYESLRSKKKFERIILVEGYLDVIALHQQGLTETVATLGTSISTVHLQKLLRYTNQLVLCFDADTAGQKAAWRALTTILPLLKDGLFIRFLSLPPPHDPDSFLRTEGLEAFEKLLRSANSLADFFFDTQSQTVDLNTLEGKAQLSALCRPHLEKIPASVLKTLMFEQLSKLVGVTQTELHTKSRFRAIKQAIMGSANRSLLHPVERAIAIVLQHPALTNTITPPMLDTTQSHSDLALLLELIATAQAHPQLSSADLIAHYQSHASSPKLRQLAQWPLLIPSQQLSLELDSIFQKMIAEDESKLIQALIAKSRTQPLTMQEKSELLELLTKKR